MGTIHSIKHSLSRDEWQAAWRLARERAAACPGDEQRRTFGIPSIAWTVWQTRERACRQEGHRATPAWLRLAYGRAVKQIDQRFA